jgi:hypothetical protein
MPARIASGPSSIAKDSAQTNVEPSRACAPAGYPSRRVHFAIRFCEPQGSAVPPIFFLLPSEKNWLPRGPQAALRGLDPRKPGCPENPFSTEERFNLREIFPVLCSSRHQRDIVAGQL